MLCPQVDVRIDSAQQIADLAPEFPFEQVDGDLDGNGNAQTLNGKKISCREPIRIIVAVTIKPERSESSAMSAVAGLETCP